MIVKSIKNSRGIFIKSVFLLLFSNQTKHPLFWMLSITRYHILLELEIIYYFYEKTAGIKLENA